MLLLSAFSLIVVALPNGAPGCSAPQKAMGSFSVDLGYKIKSSTEGLKFGQWNIMIDNPTRSSYQGLLLWVADPLLPNVHVGSFQFKNSTKWQYKSVSSCATKGVTTGAYSTITHLVPDKVEVAKMVKFLWTCPAGVDLKKLVVYGVVADKNGGGDAVPVWQAMEGVGVVKQQVSTNGTTTTAATVPESTSTEIANPSVSSNSMKSMHSSLLLLFALLQIQG